MTDASEPPKPGNWTAARGIKLILLAQIAIALFLFSADIAKVLPRLAMKTPDAPSLTSPINPGDQTRRYDHDWAPANPDLPATNDMPSRLLFEIRDEALHITGAIAEGDAKRFKDWLQSHRLPETIRLHSSGGSVTDALDIGARIRAETANTEIAKGQVCLSACPYILASGTTRKVHAKAFVGVHQHYFGENTALPAFLAVEDIQRGQGQVMAYLDTMGIDLRVMQHALTTPPESIYILIPDELTKYSLATEILR